MSLNKKRGTKVEKTEELNANTKSFDWKKLVIIGLSAVLLGVAMDSAYDHTGGECLYTKALKHVYMGDPILSVGVRHQLKEMQRDYVDFGRPVEASYIEDIIIRGHAKFDELSPEEIKELEKRGFKVVKIEKEYEPIVKANEENGMTSYSIPSDYDMVDGQGKKEAYYLGIYQELDGAYGIKDFGKYSLSEYLDTENPDTLLTKYGEFDLKSDGLYSVLIKSGEGYKYVDGIEATVDGGHSLYK